ncbi:hypothetical protein JCM10213v2_000700 [Rhodosporidiobolus nylandii]
MSGTSTNVPVTLGLMTWGREGTSGARVHDIKACEEMLDVLLKHGHNEVDTAIMYCGGTSEEYLGEIDWKSRGTKVDTKLWPAEYDGRKAKFDLDGLRYFLDIQLKAVKAEQLEIYYLHAPDYSTPLEETVAAIDSLYKEGKFKRWGVSNYPAWQVATICGIAERNGFVKPSAYQGIYNALHRAIEPELFPCLRANGISFYEFNPLGGGFFTGAVSRDADVEKGSRFDPNTSQGQNYRSRYWREEYFSAMDKIKPVAEKHGLALAEIALRWIQHHSLLSREHGDNILIGASSLGHLEANLTDMEKGPLPEEVTNVLDEAWEIVKAVASQYFRSD